MSCWRSMTKVQIELSDATARAAREVGLLTSEALGRLLRGDAAARHPFRAGLLEAAEPIGKLGLGRMRRNAGAQEKRRGDDNEAARHAMLAKIMTAAARATAWDWPATALASPMRIGHRRVAAGTAGCCRQGPPCSTSNPYSTGPRGSRICHRAAGATPSCVGGSWRNRRRRGLCGASCGSDDYFARVHVRLLSGQLD